MNYYDILGVTPQSTAEQIKKAYRKLAFLHHPDRNSSEQAEDKFKQIQHAYDILSNPSSRARYDLTLPKAKKKVKQEQPKTKAERQAEAYAAYRREAARGFTIADAPEPKFDLWGQPIRQSQVPEFRDIFAGNYESEVAPDIR